MLHLFNKPTGLPGETSTEEGHTYKSAGVLYIEASERDHGEKTSFIFPDLFCPPGGFRLSYLSLFFEVCTWFFSCCSINTEFAWLQTVTTLKVIWKLCPKLI